MEALHAVRFVKCVSQENRLRETSYDEGDTKENHERCWFEFGHQPSEPSASASTEHGDCLPWAL